MQFELNLPTVVEELIDGEIVAVQLDTGHYYSLVNEACAVWSLIKLGFNAQKIAEQFAAHHQGKVSEFLPGIEAFFLDLETEQLIRKAATTRPLDKAAANSALALLPAIFSAPTLQKYTDMQELLLLDPVHEVGATGWPAPAPETTK